VNGGPGCIAGDCSHSRYMRNYHRRHSGMAAH
jgi:hypothetical protein